MVRILVIEDEMETQNMLGQMLKHEGYEVISAYDGNKGIKLNREKPAHLAITDIFMPEKDGLETIIELRKEFPEIKIIAMSEVGILDPKLFLKIAGQFGANHTFLKPLEQNELLKTIKELVKTGARARG